jgi:hypothetical protein
MMICGETENLLGALKYCAQYYSDEFIAVSHNLVKVYGFYLNMLC